MEYKIDDKVYQVIIVKKRNKNTYIRVKEDMNIYVTTNYLATKSYIKRLTKSCKNINKLVLVSNNLKDYYNGNYNFGVSNE